MDLNQTCKSCGKQCASSENCQQRVNNFISRLTKRDLWVIEKLKKIYEKSFKQDVPEREGVLTNFFKMTDVPPTINLDGTASRLATYVIQIFGQETLLNFPCDLLQSVCCHLVLFQAALNWPSMTDSVREYIRLNRSSANANRVGDVIGEFFQLFFTLANQCQALQLDATEVHIIHAMLALNNGVSRDPFNINMVLCHYEFQNFGVSDRHRSKKVLEVFFLVSKIVQVIGVDRLTAPLNLKWNEFFIQQKDMDALTTVLYLR